MKRLEIGSQAISQKSKRQIDKKWDRLKDKVKK
jgi:hypothetical protein